MLVKWSDPKYGIRVQIEIDVDNLWLSQRFCCRDLFAIASGSLSKKVFNASKHFINSNVVDRSHKYFQTEDEQNRSFVNRKKYKTFVHPCRRKKKQNEVENHVC